MSDLNEDALLKIQEELMKIPATKLVTLCVTDEGIRRQAQKLIFAAGTGQDPEAIINAWRDAGVPEDVIEATEKAAADLLNEGF